MALPTVCKGEAGHSCLLTLKSESGERPGRWWSLSCLLVRLLQQGREVLSGSVCA